jgi:bla regulator protein blaR1
MIHWMLYVLAVSLVLGIAALVAERSLRLRRRATRWVWVGAIVASLLVPTLIASISIQVPNLSEPTAPQKSIVLRELTSLPFNPLGPVAVPSPDPAAAASLEAWLKLGWLVASCGMLLLLSLSAAQLFWRERRWQRTTVAGIPVRVAPGVGPAVVGLFRSRIVVPPWVVEAPASMQALVMAHEQSHIGARDPLLLTTGIGLLIFMPWNLPLWWQFHRLRRAIEVDCDARVLDAGHDVNRYGETLIEVGLRQSAFLGTVAAMSESPSFLEQRIRIMLNQRGKWWKSSAALLACASMSLVAVAVQVTPPNSGPASSANAETPKEIAVDPAIYDGYVGFYNLADSAVFTVTREGNRLLVRLTGQDALEAFPSSRTEFFYKVVKARIAFDVDPQGQARTLTLFQNGKQLTAPRMDAQAAQRIEQTRTARLQSQTPAPGSEAALRRLYGSLLDGKPNYDEMGPDLAQATREQLPKLLDGAQKLGAIQSVEFRGVSAQGMDVYELRHERGRTRFLIAMSTDGKISGAVMRPGP